MLSEARNGYGSSGKLHNPLNSSRYHIEILESTKENYFIVKSRSLDTYVHTFFQREKRTGHPTPLSPGLVASKITSGSSAERYRAFALNGLREIPGKLSGTVIIMVRNYKSKPGSRSYANYTEQQLDSALKDVIENGMSLRKAAEKRLEGKKVLLGDNLASHFNPEVLRVCEENDIAFVCLPPNSTNILQPLDVAFFRPFKQAWRNTLLQWKLKHPKMVGIPKPEVPSLLKCTLEKMDLAPPKRPDGEKSAIKRNLMKGFETCGIVPLNQDKALSKLPQEDHNVIENDMNSSLIEFLKEQRFGSAVSRPRQKKKRLRVQPGKSVTSHPIEETESEGEEFVENMDQSEDDMVTETVSDSLPEYQEPTKENIIQGKFILARFRGGRRNATEFKYVCIVQEVLSNGEIKTLGLKSCNSKKLFKVQDDDVSQIIFSDVIVVLPEPIMQQQGCSLVYSFPHDIDIMEN
ncbi:hypothetical protein ANN_14956 [Periplaneta americana]|uniref:DDE-1 domain-containing protein n=1 Tax=Periplaneta americana TaxID=6978 RepID=A0ABQ8SXT8_PERAM|nr:hypothetical protein ANN_14956 [Periplaneta americana]